MKPKVAYLRTTTWAGVGIGAIHYYGKLIYGDEREDIEIVHELTQKDADQLNLDDPTDIRGNPYKEGEFSSRFLDEHSVIMAGIEMFQGEVEPKGYNVLLLGDSFTLDPQPMLYGDKDLMVKANQLCFQFEDLGGWGCEPEDELDVKALCKRWEDLIETFKIPKRFNLMIGFKDDPKSAWPEEYSDKDLEKWSCKNPKDLGQSLVNFFNGSLKPGEKERVFVGVEKG